MASSTQHARGGVKATVRISRSQWLGVGLLLGAITAGHYLTDPAHSVGHDLFRRLYYLPIVWAAFTGGFWAGVGAAFVAAAAYVPQSAKAQPENA